MMFDTMSLAEHYFESWKAIKAWKSAQAYMDFCLKSMDLLTSLALLSNTTRRGFPCPMHRLQARTTAYWTNGTKIRQY